MVTYFIISLVFMFVFACLRFPSYDEKMHMYESFLSARELIHSDFRYKGTQKSRDEQRELLKKFRQSYKKYTGITKLFFWLPIPIVFLLTFWANIIFEPVADWKNIFFYWELLAIFVLAIPEINCCLFYYDIPFAWGHNNRILIFSFILLLLIFFGLQTGILYLMI